MNQLSFSVPIPIHETWCIHMKVKVSWLMLRIHIWCINVTLFCLVHAETLLQFGLIDCGVIVRQSGSFIFRFGWRGVGSSAMDLRERLGSRLKGVMRARTPQLWLLVHCTWDGHPRMFLLFSKQLLDRSTWIIRVGITLCVTWVVIWT